jgi:hypothetical protein
LGLAYFWVGSDNGVQLQLWSTWLLYAVLIDLTDAVAEQLNQPFAAISLEMVYRGLYHFTQAHHRHEATDPVVYLAEHAVSLGILKRKRKEKRPSPLLMFDLTDRSSPQLVTNGFRRKRQLFVALELLCNPNRARTIFLPRNSRWSSFFWKK